MLKLAEYRQHPALLADCLPWAGLVASIRAPLTASLQILGSDGKSINKGMGPTLQWNGTKRTAVAGVFKGDRTEFQTPHRPRRTRKLSSLLVMTWLPPPRLALPGRASQVFQAVLSAPALAKIFR